MKVETKIQMEQRLKNEARQLIKDRINEKMEIQIKHFKNKNKKRNDKAINNYQTSHQNHTNNHPKYFNNTKTEELNNFKNNSDYEAMWEIAIDKLTRTSIGTSTETIKR